MGSKNEKFMRGLVVFFVLVTIASLIYAFGGFKGLNVAEAPKSTVVAQTTGSGANAIVSGTTSLTGVTFVDEQVQNTALTGTTYYKLNNNVATSSKPSVSLGDKLQFLFYNGSPTSSAIGTLSDTFTVNGSWIGGKSLTLTAPTYSVPTVAFYQTYSALANHTTGAGVNGTKSASGGALKPINIQMQATNLKSTGDMIVVFEFSSSANVSANNVLFTDAVGQKFSNDIVPTAYSRKNTNGLVVSYSVPAQKTTALMNYYLNAQATSSKIIQGVVYMTVYSKQAFLESDGTFGYGVEDKLQTSKAAYVRTFAFVLQ